jgi:hypothetical protein
MLTWGFTARDPTRTMVVGVGVLEKAYKTMLSGGQ